MNKIQNKIDNLFDELEKSKLYNDYLKVKKQLESNEEIVTIINKIKRLQKIATNNKDKNVELEIRKLYDKLYEYPLYQSYLIVKEEIEEELFQIKEQFDKYFKDILKL